MSQSSNSRESDAPLRSDEGQVNAAVKALLKNVLVPAMVQQYIAARSVADETVIGDEPVLGRSGEATSK